MESSVTIGPVTLDTSTSTSLLADVTRELPPGGWNVVDTVNGLEEHRIGETDFRNPQGAYDMSPAVVISLFKSASSIGTQSAINSSGR